MPSVESITNEVWESIRAHYCSGYFDLETSLLRIQNGGFESISRGTAAEVLRQPISVETVKDLTGKSGENITDEQIAARLAEVTA